MKKTNIMTLVLLFVVVSSTVLGCGKSEITGDNNSTTKAASAESTKEETKASEPTTVEGESTISESATSSEVVRYDEFKMEYSFCPISAETKQMLLKKLTNLELVKGQKFDMTFLTFKEDEQSAYNSIKSTFVTVLGEDLTCDRKRIELYKIDSNDDGMVFYFKKVYK